MAVEITELSQVRISNLHQLHQEMGSPPRKDFGERLGIKYATLAGLMGEKPKQNLGNKIAGQIEKAAHKAEGWLDKDRRNGGSTAPDTEVGNTLSMNAFGFIVQDRPINNYQAKEVMRVLLED